MHAMPTKCLKAENLFDIVKRIIIGLGERDFQILSIITDNKKSYIFQISQIYYSKFSVEYPHTVIKYRPIFFLIDSVHILKCIKNNCICLKDANKFVIIEIMN